MNKKRLTDYLPFKLVSQNSKAWVSCSITEPTGDGVRDANFILYGPVMGDMSQWFDTYQDIADSSPQSYTLHWSQIKPINSIFFMHGPAFYEGGWWTDLSIQYLDINNTWHDVTSVSFTPPYDFKDERSNRCPFETYEIRFPVVEAIAIRLLGTPGGLCRFTSMAYLNAGYTTPDHGNSNRMALQFPQPELLRFMPPNALWDLISSLRAVTGIAFDVQCREGLGLDHFLYDARHQEFHEYQKSLLDPTSLYMILGKNEGWQAFGQEIIATRKTALTSHQPEICIHHGGMVWIVIPIVVDGILLGTLENRNLIALDPIDQLWHEKTANRLGIDPEQYANALADVPVYKEAYLQSVIQHMQVMIRMARQQIQYSMEIANLRAKKDTVEEVNQAKTIFLAKMSHEIRTPLHAIVGLTNLMLDTELDELQQYYAENIRKSNDSLLKLVNDLLDFSKIESGKLALEEQPFDLHRCLQESIDLLSTKAADKGLYLTHHISHQTPQFVQGDVSHLRQVLVNLLDNGVKFTERGGVSLFVESQVVKNRSHRLHFRIQDTGIGIPLNRLHHLFNLFSQVDGSTTRKYSGTGLGLAISKELLEIMGGTIWVESEIDQGSIFHFTLTLPVVSESALPSQGPPTPIDPQMGTHHPLRILIADDQPVNLTVARHLLNRLGYRADVAINGLEALQALQRQTYDIVFMDVQMPEMDGLQATRAIKVQIPEEEQPRIVALTANTQPGAREECLAAGMDDYISKPVRIEELVLALSQTSSRSPSTLDAQAVGLEEPISTSSVQTKVETTFDLPVQVKLFEEMMGPDSFELLVEILETFLLEIPNNLPHLHRAIKDNDTATVRQIAHSIKGSASSVTAQPLADAARSLETSARQGDLSQAEEQVQRLEEEFTRLQEWVNTNLS